MTIKKSIATHGWQAECDTQGSRSMDVQVAFLNGTVIDETEFCIRSYDVEELNALFRDFCRENRLPSNTVAGVYIVRAYDVLPEYVWEVQ